MHIIPGNAQHQGSRKEQQDDFGFSDLTDDIFVAHGGVLALITDGMGGLALGREASMIAKSTMLREYEQKSPSESIPYALERALNAANTAVVEMARMNMREGEVGTTLAAAIIYDYKLYWISVGDSRIYLWRHGKLTQISKDHNFKMLLSKEVQNRNISLENANHHPERDALISYIGLQKLPEVDRNEEPLTLQAGDRILLCSDGLYKFISELEINQLISGPPQDAANAMMEAAIAKRKHNQDNVTVVILGCDPGLPLDAPASFPKTTMISKKRIFKVCSIFIIVALLFVIAYYYFNFNSWTQFTIKPTSTAKKITSQQKSLLKGEASSRETSKTQDNKMRERP
jgi:PPM family protein phosphatase